MGKIRLIADNLSKSKMLGVSYFFMHFVIFFFFKNKEKKKKNILIGRNTNFLKDVTIASIEVTINMNLNEVFFWWSFFIYFFFF